MSATEVIAEIEKLPQAEQDKILVYLIRSHSARTGDEARHLSYATPAEAEAAGDFVFREHAELLRRLAQ